MPPESPQPCRLTIGDFSFDPEDGSLVRNGVRLRLARQPQRLLEALLRAQGHVVSRDVLAHALWPHNPQLDVDGGLNAAVHKLRIGFGDVFQPFRYIETLPGRGYRLIAAVSVYAQPPHVPETTQASGVTDRRPPDTRAPVRAPAVAAAVGALVVLVFALVGWPRGMLERAAVEFPSANSADHPSPAATLEVMPFRSVDSGPAEVLLATALEHALRSELQAALASRAADDEQLARATGQRAAALPRRFELEGQVDRAGENMRLTLRLVEPGGHGETWALILERRAAELIAEHDLVAREVLQALHHRTAPRSAAKTG